jgi:hypothetical protein
LDRFTPQRRIVELLNRRIEGVHIDVSDNSWPNHSCANHLGDQFKPTVDPLPEWPAAGLLGAPLVPTAWLLLRGPGIDSAGEVLERHKWWHC